MFRFFAMIGDYKSMLILLPKPPKNCPSMDIKSIYLYVKWKRSKKNCRLMYSDEDVKDIFGEVIYCEEAWNAPSNVHQLLGSISCIHRVNNQCGRYKDVCDECVNELQNGDKMGCQHHLYSPQHVRSGCPVQSSMAGDLQRFNTKDSKGHKSNAAEQLFPEQVDMLRSHMISQVSKHTRRRNHEMVVD